MAFGLGALSAVAAFYLWRGFSLLVIRSRLRADAFLESFEVKAPLTPFTAHIILRGDDWADRSVLDHRRQSITADFPMFAFEWTRVVKAAPHPVVPD